MNKADRIQVHAIALATLLGVCACTAPAQRALDARELPSDEKSIGMLLEESTVRELATDRHALTTSILIAAPAQRVWDVLIDFERMPEWSPMLQKIEPTPLTDGRLVKVTSRLNGEDMVVNRTLIYAEGAYYGWSDEIELLPGIRDRHLYRVEVVDESHTRLVQSEEFSGDSERMTTEALARYVAPLYRAFNEALKDEVQRRYAEQNP